MEAVSENVLQQQLVGIPEAVTESAGRLAETLAILPIEAAIVLIALVPAVCEELLFRGFLLSGLSSSAGRWMRSLAAHSTQMARCAGSRTRSTVPSAA